jgi:uncharacterized surface protein with fasciclin (FAS1) repeats
MKHIALVVFATGLLLTFGSCVSNQVQDGTTTETTQETTEGGGQSGVQDDLSQKNVVQVAIGSKDHTKLVKAVKQAELVDALSNAGPFTVFAPVDAAFEKLPPGTLDDLMKEENKEKLADILQYHVFVGVLREEMLKDGQKLGQVNGGSITISKHGDEIMVNNSAKVLASVPASNGMIYVIDKVLLPK